jgi:hypothetical protein
LPLGSNTTHIASEASSARTLAIAFIVVELIVVTAVPKNVIRGFSAGDDIAHDSPGPKISARSSRISAALSGEGAVNTTIFATSL